MFLRKKKFEICFIKLKPCWIDNIVVFTAQVKMPSGKIDLPVIEDNFDGTVRVQYNPKEDGVHELILLHNGAPVQGNCYQAFFRY